MILYIKYGHWGGGETKLDIRWERKKKCAVKESNFHLMIFSQALKPFKLTGQGRYIKRPRKEAD